MAAAQPAELDAIFLGGRTGRPGQGVVAMSPDELQVCAQRVQSIETATSYLRSLHAGLQTRLRELTVRGNELERARTELDVRRAKDVRAFNDRAVRHQERLARYRGDVQLYGEDAVLALSDIAAFAAQCTTRHALRKDLEMLAPAQRAALETTQKPFDLPEIVRVSGMDAVQVPEMVAVGRGTKPR